MDKTLKKNINILVPLVIATGGGFFMFKKGKDYKFIIAITIMLFVIMWIFTKKITDYIEQKQNQPDQVNVGADVAGQIDKSFDPTSTTDRLKADIYAPFYQKRDAGIYDILVKLSNANLVKVYNDWNSRYFAEDNETMIAAMRGETYGNNLLDNVAANVEAIIGRLEGIGLN